MQTTAILILMTPMQMAQELARANIAELQKRTGRRPAPTKRLPLRSIPHPTVRVKINWWRHPAPVTEPKCAL